MQLAKLTTVKLMSTPVRMGISQACDCQYPKSSSKVRSRTCCYYWRWHFQGYTKWLISSPLKSI